MKQVKQILLGGLGLALLAGCGLQAARPAPASSPSTAPSLAGLPPHAAHQVIVGYQSLSALSAAAQAVGGRVLSTIPKLRAALIELNSLSTGQALFALQGVKGISFTQPNWQRKLFPLETRPLPAGSGQPVTASDKTSAGLVSSLNGDPTKAPYFGLQGALQGPPGGLNVVQAWQDLAQAGEGAGSVVGTNGSQPVTVAYFAEPLAPVPDFAGQVVPGFDFNAWACGTYPNSYLPDPSSPNYSVSQNPQTACSASNPAQVLNNSTSFGSSAPANVLPGVNYNTPNNPGGESQLDVSNMVANGTGITGVAYDAQVMPLVVFSNNNPYGGAGNFEGDFAYAAEILWAAGHGAQILNNSLGGQGYSPLDALAFNEALLGGVTAVAASGDNGDALVSNPADIPGVIAVTATTVGGNLSWLGQIAPYVQFGAPGNWILTAGAAGFQSCSAANPDCPLGVFPVPGYGYEAGTSSASPYLVGVAALVDGAYAQKFRRFMTPGEIDQVLAQTATQVSGSQTAYGIPNAAAAVQHVNNLSAPLTNPTGYAAVYVTDSQGQPVQNANVVLTSTSGGPTYYSQTLIGLTETTATSPAYFFNIQPGTYSVQVTAGLPFGNLDFAGTGNPSDEVAVSGTLTVAPTSLSGLQSALNNETLQTALGSNVLSLSLPATTATVTLTTPHVHLALAIGEPGNTTSCPHVSGYVLDRGNGVTCGTAEDGSFSVSQSGSDYTVSYTLGSSYALGTYAIGLSARHVTTPVAGNNTHLQITENGVTTSYRVPAITPGTTLVSVGVPVTALSVKP